VPAAKTQPLGGTDVLQHRFVITPGMLGQLLGRGGELRIASPTGCTVGGQGSMYVGVFMSNFQVSAKHTSDCISTIYDNHNRCKTMNKGEH
jgi:hypothetical protein